MPLEFNRIVFSWWQDINDSTQISCASVMKTSPWSHLTRYRSAHDSIKYWWIHNEKNNKPERYSIRISHRAGVFVWARWNATVMWRTVLLYFQVGHTSGNTTWNPSLLFETEIVSLLPVSRALNLTGSFSFAPNRDKYFFAFTDAKNTVDNKVASHHDRRFVMETWRCDRIENNLDDTAFKSKRSAVILTSGSLMRAKATIRYIIEGNLVF